jgi:GTP pyrophosphokinase
MTIKELAKKQPTNLISRAYAFSMAAHKEQQRKTGEPYFNHALATAETLNNWHLDEATIAAGLLHDTVEDTNVPLEEIKREFGGEIAFLVDGVTKLGRIKYRGAEGKAENLRKMILALSKDLRVVFIKLADRLHNMRTLQALPPAKQKRVALETDEIYAPLAYRLGMHNISGELEDLAFPYLHPQEYRWLLSTTKEQYNQRLAYLQKLKAPVRKLLEKHNIKPIDIEIRAKRYASLYKKLLRHDMNMGRIYDLVAMRVVVGTIPECYAALGIIHETWPPVPRRIKDYIAMAKPNGYRSLHTTVIGPEEKMIEFQIRTKSMHDENENGVAAHWLYDQTRRGEKVSGKQLAEDLTWVQQLKDWQDRFFGSKHDPKDIIAAMKIDFFKDRIFAVTPRGDVIDLPQGATPVDFAYHIHSIIGNSCAGARVNGALAPLDYKLKSGDVVEIVTQKGKKPSEDWLRFAKTGIARDHIRIALRGKDSFSRIAKAPNRTEMRVTVDVRTGLIKDISAIIANQHFTILNFHTENSRGSRFQLYRVELQTTDRAKVERLIVKIKRIKEVKEVSYRLL